MLPSLLARDIQQGLQQFLITGFEPSDDFLHGVHPVQVSQWKKEIQEQARTLFEGKRGPQPVAAHSEPDRLYGEIGRLKMELDWLKKKSGISLP